MLTLVMVRVLVVEETLRIEGTLRNAVNSLSLCSHSQSSVSSTSQRNTRTLGARLGHYRVRSVIILPIREMKLMYSYGRDQQGT
jgi:hypothetical protein